MWAVGVNVNGDRATKFIVNKDRNVIIMILLVPLFKFGFINELISFVSGISIDCVHVVIFVIFFILDEINKMIGIKREVHAIDMLLVDGSKIENRLFIIFILCFLI